MTSRSIVSCMIAVLMLGVGSVSADPQNMNHLLNGHYAYSGSALWSTTTGQVPIRLGSISEPARYIMLVESNQACADMGIWALEVQSKSWGLKQGYFVHPTKRMQALFFDGHAKSTKFSQTLGSNNDDQQWAFDKSQLPPVDLARKGLQTDPQIQAVYGG